MILTGTERNKRRRTALCKQIRVLFGGKCGICGYDRCYSALEFHHIDRSTKLFNLSVDNMRNGWNKIVAEAKKCLLVCANCHREIELGLVTHELVLTSYARQQSLATQLDAGSIPACSTKSIVRPVPNIALNVGEGTL